MSDGRTCPFSVSSLTAANCWPIGWRWELCGINSSAEFRVASAAPASDSFFHSRVLLAAFTMVTFIAVSRVRVIPRVQPNTTALAPHSCLVNCIYCHTFLPHTGRL